jgi:choline dehydrogenase
VTADGYDVIIVGGGAAGCVLARRVSERGGRSVLLVEAGPDLRSNVPDAWRDGWDLPRGEQWTRDWGFISEPDAGGQTSPLRRGRVLGGTSWLTRFAVRGAASDFDAWAARGNPTWTFADVLPTFVAIEADAQFGDREWHGATGPIHVSRYPELPRSEIHQAALEAFASAGLAEVGDHNAPDAVGFGPMPMSTRDGKRQTTLDAYLDPAHRPPRLTIRADAEVASVMIESGHAVGVQLSSGSQLRADLVVLAAGTYGSPTILMRSGVGDSAHLREMGIDLVAELPGVGANLADHPAADLDSGWRGDAVPPGPILHSIATFRSARQPATEPPDMMFWVTDPAGDDPAFYLDPILLKPQARGSVRLRSADPVEKPRITLPGLVDADVERLMEGYRLGVELASHPRVRALAKESPPDVQSAAELRRRVLEAHYSIPHVVGTCRMGPSAADGDVVDAGGKVHGVEGLVVADASVIPDATAGFPHIVTIMLAERIAAGL